MNSPRWMRRAMGAGLLALALSACGADSSPAETSAPAETNGAETDLVATAAGGQIDIGALEGTDTVLWFWAPW